MMEKAAQNTIDTIRVPVYSEQQYRRNTVDKFDQAFINCFPEPLKNLQTGEGGIHVVKRPGIQETTLDLFATTAAGARADILIKAHIGITQLSDVMVAAFHDVTANKIYVCQYRPVAATYVLIGTISSVTVEDKSIFLTECQLVSGGIIYPGIMMNVCDLKLTNSQTYWARSNGTVFTAASLTLISAAAYPSVVGKVVTGPVLQHNGKFHAYTTDGIIYTSGSTAGTANDPTLWNALTTIRTYQYPDGGLRIERYKHHIVAFGKDSIEFFNDVGNPSPATPLKRTDQAFIHFGSYSNRSVISTGDAIFWIAKGITGDHGVYKLEGYAPVKISTVAEDERIRLQLQGATNFAVTEALALHSTVISGKKTLLIANLSVASSVYNAPITPGTLTEDFSITPETQATGNVLAYNIVDNLWWSIVHSVNSEISLYPAQTYPAGGLASSLEYVPYFFLFGENSGRVYTWAQENPGYYIDESTEAGADRPVLMAIGFTTTTFGTSKRKRIIRVEPVFTETPKILSANSADNMVMYLSWENYNVYVVGSTFSRGIKYPNNAHRYYWNNLGMGRYWNFGFLFLSKDPCSIAGLDVTFEQEAE